MTTAAWTIATAAELNPGDRISFDEDALDALDAGRPGDVNWSYIRSDSVVVTRFARIYDGDYTWAIHVVGDPEVIRATHTARLVRQAADAPVRKTVDTSRFEALHMRKPKGYGLWIFEDQTGHQHPVTATYTVARHSLPGGEWKLLP